MEEVYFEGFHKRQLLVLPLRLEMRALPYENDLLELPTKLESVAVIAFGWPNEEKELRGRWKPGKIHFDKW